MSVSVSKQYFLKESLRSNHKISNEVLKFRMTSQLFLFVLICKTRTSVLFNCLFNRLLK